MIIKLPKQGTETYEKIYDQIMLLKKHFDLRRTTIELTNAEYNVIREYVDYSFVLTQQEKVELKEIVKKIQSELPELDRQRNLPYNKVLASLNSLEDDFLTDVYLRPSTQELEKDYLKVLNNLSQNDELTQQEKDDLGALINKKIDEIPSLNDKRNEEEEELRNKKEQAFKNAEKRYNEQSSLTKLKQILITRTSINDVRNDYESMSVNQIDNLYQGKKR